MHAILGRGESFKEIQRPMADKPREVAHFFGVSFHDLCKFLKNSIQMIICAFGYPARLLLP